MKRIIDHKHVQKTDGCWIWNGPLNVKGYGQVSYRDNGRQRTMGAHKMAFIQEVGPVPDGRLVCHSCDTRNCVNPEHLWIGTHKQNMDDMKRKGRSSGKKNAAKIAQTHCKRGHEYTPENTGIKNPGLKRKHGRRYCIICRRLTSNRYTEENKEKIAKYQREWKKRKAERREYS